MSIEQINGYENESNKPRFDGRKWIAKSQCSECDEYQDHEIVHMTFDDGAEVTVIECGNCNHTQVFKR
jgi:Zn ribbon nucleic-acid-binding protein